MFSCKQEGRRPITTNIKNTIQFDFSASTILDKVDFSSIDLSFILDRIDVSYLIKTIDFSNILTNDLSNLFNNQIDEKINDTIDVKLHNLSYILKSNLLFTLRNDLSYIITNDLSNLLNNRINERINDAIDVKLYNLYYVNDVSQTFFQIMTQQPYNFDISDEPFNSSSKIQLSWNYDKIIAYFDELQDDNNKALLSLFNNKQKNLPYIDYIKFDISGCINYVNTGWIDFSTIYIDSNEEYTMEKYKIIDINKYLDLDNIDNSVNQILSTNNPFSIRIYGNNNSIDYPTIENRSLIFNDLSFLIALAPSKPINISNIAENLNELKTIFKVLNNEMNNADSDALLKYYDISYSEINSLASNIIDICNNSFNDISLITMCSCKSLFNIILKNLKSARKYKYQVKVKNDLIDCYSEYSDISISEYTKIVDSSNIDIHINTNIINNKQFITNNSFDNNNIIYINLSDNHNINFENNLLQYIEITKPYFLNQEYSNIGFGKFVDNSLNLVSINININDISKQSYIFDASFSSNNVRKINYNNNNYDFLNSYLLNDMYNADNNNKGLRLKGQFKINNILNSDISNVIGDPSINPYKLTYNYYRNNDICGLNQSYDYNIYIDDLDLDPNVIINNENIVKEVLYCTGIPSVKYFDISFNRNYTNINSQYMYINGNKLLTTIGTIANTSCNLSKNIFINSGSINIDGSYNFDNNTINNLTNNNYNNLNYNLSILNNDFSLNWNETVYNLKKTDGKIFDISLITNHYCDLNSFNQNSNNLITSCKLNLTDICVCEISNINIINNDISNIEIDFYTNHEKMMKPWSLLYINDKFQNNATQNYPNINDYSYNNLTITNDFSYNNYSYNLNGILTTNDNGYKWIGFRILKDSSNSLLYGNGAYIFNEISYNILTTNDGTNIKYLPLKEILNDSLFTNNVVNKLFDILSDDVIGFGYCTINNNNKHFFNIKALFNPIGGNWIQNGFIENNKTLNYLFSNYNYGCNVNSLGIYCDYRQLKNDLTFFIGIKNNINLY